jgi:hypothetical protein
MYSDGGADSSYGEGGSGWFSGLFGGDGGSCGDIAAGGFGGGGQGRGCHGGGGGGGYSGGEGGRVAGGGGTYNAASDAVSVGGAREGHGYVLITMGGSGSGTTPGGGDTGLIDPGGDTGVIEVPDGSCGDGVVDPGEEYDPAPGPFTGISVDESTCRWDFDGVRQLYCNGSCSWAGASSCDAADADILCQLLTDNPASTAISWTDTTALDEGGFACPAGYGTAIETDRGFSGEVRYQDASILADHGSGSVIADPVCTDPS